MHKELNELFNALRFNMERQRLHVFEESFEYDEKVKMTNWIKRRKGQNQKQTTQCRKTGKV